MDTGQLRRYACDRCRGHKLRCERASNSATGNCTRCLRKGVACATGLSQRMGRPSLSSTSSVGTVPRRRKSHAASLSSASSAERPESTVPGHTEPAPAVRLESSSATTPETSPIATSTGQITAQFDFSFPAAEQSDGLDFSQSMEQEQHQDQAELWPSAHIGSTFMGLPTTGMTFDTNEQLTSASHLSTTISNFAATDSDPFRFTSQFTPTESDTTASSRPDGISSFGYSTSNGTQSLSATVPSEDLFDMTVDPPHPRADSLKEILLKKLSSLSGHLLQDLERIGQANPAESLPISSASSASSSIPASPPLGETHNVGRMLEHSEKYLEILQHVAQPASQAIPMSDASPAAASVRYFNLEANDSNPGVDGGSTTTLSQLLGDGFSPAQLPVTAPLDASDGKLSSQGSENVIRPDIPTMLAILTCYTCLIRLYGRVFSYIQRVLHASPSARQRLLPPLPGLHLCGFKLEQHQNLQLEILARVSLHMLGRIDKILDDIGASCVASGLMEQSVAANLLNMIVRQDLNVGLDGARAADGSLKEITSSIRKLLDAKLAAL